MMQTTGDFTLTTYTDLFQQTEPVYRALCPDGRVLYVNADTLESSRECAPEDQLFSSAFWLESRGDGELVWIAAICEACGGEFRPIDGYYDDEQEPTYSYCAQCCKW